MKRAVAAGAEQQARPESRPAAPAHALDPDRAVGHLLSRAGDVIGSLGAPQPATLAVLRDVVTSLERGVRAGYREQRVEAPRHLGVAIEGWAVGATLRDLRDDGRRLSARLARDGDDEAVRALLAAGAGMALGLREGGWRDGERRFTHLPRTLHEAAWDGYGFARALLEPYRIRGAVRLGGPPEARASLLRGAGRALYFLHAGDLDAMRRRLERTREPTHLARGIGVASMFVGGVPAEPLARALAAHRAALEEGRHLGAWLASRLEGVREEAAEGHWV